MADLLADLSTAQLEALQAVLSQKIDGLAGNDLCLEHPHALLSRLGLETVMDPDGLGGSRLVEWLAAWRHAGGNGPTLAMAVASVLAERMAQRSSQRVELVWSGPSPGVGTITRDQSVLIRQLVEQAQKRLLVTTYAIYPGPFIRELMGLVQQRMALFPTLRVRLVCNIHRPKGNTSTPEQLVKQFREKTWPALWGDDAQESQPEVFFDPRSTSLRPEAVCHVKAVVADDGVLVTSANLTDAAQLHNFELGVRLSSPTHADAVWLHFQRLVETGLLKSLF
ncbi:phospholipase D-like domain-containing protein [Cyanobium sp. FGCU-52]|nr:phospholipase D-like domain-containing protein [Cyanobium sp. FGCU52]